MDFVSVISDPNKSSCESMTSRHEDLFDFTGDKERCRSQELEVLPRHGHLGEEAIYVGDS